MKITIAVGAMVMLIIDQMIIRGVYDGSEYKKLPWNSANDATITKLIQHNS